MLRVLFGLIVLFWCETLLAQHVHTDRCGTGDVMDAYFQKHPEYRQLFESRQKQLRTEAARKSRAQFRAVASMEIPVVFHILLADPSQVTDAQIMGQLQTINDDFGGRNADSTRIPAPFKPSFGKSAISFCLAQRNPDNEPASGIIRKTVSISAAPGEGDPVKYTAQGGSDAWDTRRYLNVWVVNISGGTLGYSFLPGTPGLPDAEMGLVLNFRFTGNSGSATAPFNLGRTATHELGHFFGLQHIWGASQNISSCNDSDGVADTPNQDTANYGKPSYPLRDACSSTIPGVMFMNFMDYVDDAAMVMFTNGQVNLMETALMDAMDRRELPASDGCTPPVVFPLNANLKSILFPAEGAVLCAGLARASVLIRNSGSAALNSVRVVANLNGAVVYDQVVNLNLPSYAETTVPLSFIVNPGSDQELNITLSRPNGGIDGDLSNNILSTAFTAAIPGSLPLMEGFESGGIPANWSLKTTGSAVWQITSQAAHTGRYSAYFSNFTVEEPGVKSDLVVQPLNAGNGDSLSLSFYVAAGLYNGSFLDTLEVLVSRDCGENFVSVYKKWGNSLATAPNTSDAFVPSGADQWRKETIDISAFNTGGLQVVFRNINQFGNNIFLDDINIEAFAFPSEEAALVQVINPRERLCAPEIRPEVVIRNNGISPLTALSVSYSIDGGTPVFFNYAGNLERFEEDTVALPTSGVAVGEHILSVWISEPNGVEDAFLGNDTIVQDLVRREAEMLPVISGFEDNRFPPEGWDLRNDLAGSITWVPVNTASFEGNTSVFMRNYIYNDVSAQDELLSPFMTYGPSDSVYVSFRIAARPSLKTGIPDYFEVLLTKDCGLTYESVYLKSSVELATQDAQQAEFTPDNPSQWRKDSVNLTPNLVQNNGFYLVFRNINNFDNNIYLDDVRVYTRTLPARLKEEGVLISPTAFTNMVIVQHYRPPVDLRYIRIVSTSGKQVFRQSYNGNASSYIPLNLGFLASGMYYVQLGYIDNEVTQKILKIP